MPEEVILDIPWNIIHSGKGIAIDIGGSVIKFIYLHKDDWVEPTNRSKDVKGQLRLVNFAKEQMDEGFTYVTERLHMIRESPDEIVNIFTTGLGGSQFQARIQSQLNVKSTNVSEMDCFVQCFTYLMENMKRKDFLFETCEQAYHEVTQANIDNRKMVDKLKGMTAGVNHVKNKDIRISAPDNSHHQDQPLADEPGIYPCTLYFCGSGFGGIKIGADKSFTLVDTSSMGGRALLGLGCLLTDVKTFDEFISLCEKGDASNIGNMDSLHIHSIAQRKEAMEPEDIVSFFGKGVSKTTDDFRKEDLARHLLEMFIVDLAQTAYYTCVASDTKNLFCAGGFVNNKLVRYLLTREWLKRNISMQTFAPIDTIQVGIHFMKPGTHLGAIGAYLNSHMQFISDSGEFITESDRDKD